MLAGTASVNWGFDPLYYWTNPPSFEQMLTEMAESGYAGTEISYHFPTDIPALRDDLARHRLARGLDLPRSAAPRSRLP